MLCYKNLICKLGLVYEHNCFALSQWFLYFLNKIYFPCCCVALTTISRRDRIRADRQQGIQHSNRYPFMHLERGTVRIKCFAQEQNKMIPSRARTRRDRSIRSPRYIYGPLRLHMGVVLVVEFSLYISTFLLINNNIIQIFSAVSAVAMASVLGCAQILKEGKPSEKKFSQTSAMPRFSWFFSTRNGQNQLNVSLNTTTPW